MWQGQSEWKNKPAVSVSIIAWQPKLQVTLFCFHLLKTVIGTDVLQSLHTLAECMIS